MSHLPNLFSFFFFVLRAYGAICYVFCVRVDWFHRVWVSDACSTKVYTGRFGQTDTVRGGKMVQRRRTTSLIWWHCHSNTTELIHTYYWQLTHCYRVGFLFYFILFFVLVFLQCFVNAYSSKVGTHTRTSTRSFCHSRHTGVSGLRLIEEIHQQRKVGSITRLFMNERAVSPHYAHYSLLMAKWYGLPLVNTVHVYVWVSGSISQ